MTLIKHLAPYFDRYITLERVHPVATYNYKARGFFGLPVIEIAMHQPKCTADSWLYVAVPMGASLAKLRAEEKLYVGSQTLDRMFRGDGMGGSNFHHAQMRAGNGDDNPINFLRSDKKIDIYRISGATIAKAVAEVRALQPLQPLLAQPTKHIGYWFEQLVLYSDDRAWRWNTASVDGPAQAVLRSL